MTENNGNNSQTGTPKEMSVLEMLDRGIELINSGQFKPREQDYPESGLDMDVPAEVYLEMLRQEEQRKQNQGK